MTAKLMSKEQQLQRIDELDLEPITFKLVHPEPGETAMTVDEADKIVSLYRKFLKLCVMYPESAIVPSKEIDKAWHAHILDTMKYQQDCEAIFGFLLHHFPYLGQRGTEDFELLQQKFTETHELFIKHFGVDVVDEALCDGGGCDGGGTCGSGSEMMRLRPQLTRS